MSSTMVRPVSGSMLSGITGAAVVVEVSGATVEVVEPSSLDVVVVASPGAVVEVTPATVVEVALSSRVVEVDSGAVVVVVPCRSSGSGRVPLVKAGLITPTSSTGRKLRVPVVPTASSARSRSSTPGSWTRMERLPCTDISGSWTEPRFSMRRRMISTALSSTAASVSSGATSVTAKPPLRSSPRVGPQPVTAA